MSNRSGTTYSAPTDADRRPVMLGASTADGITPLPLEVDPVTGQLQVSGGGGGGGGTQYTELATTSPATGNLTLGRYVTALPTLTNGQLNEPMLDSSSRLILGVSSAIIGNIELTDGTNIANTLKADGTAAGNNAIQTAPARYQTADSAYIVDGTPAKLRVNNQGKLWVYSNDNQQIIVNDNSGSSNFTAATQTNTQTTSGMGSGTIGITGTWAATVVFEVTTDGSNWLSISGRNMSTGALESQATANGNWQFDVAGWQQIRARCSAYTSGTAVVFVRAGFGSGANTLIAPLPVGTNSIGSVTANAGTNLNTSALALETGGNLAAIKTDVDKIPSQGQALAAASMPVVLPTAQITTLTPPTNTGYALDASLTTIDTDLKSNITLHAGTNVIGHVITDTNSTTAVTQATASNLNAAVVGTKTNNNVAPGATNLGVLPGIANASVQTWTEGDQVLESMDLAGNQRTTLGTLLAGEDLPNNVMKIEQRVTYTNLSASTNAVKTGAGRFFGFIVNSHTNGTLKFWDNTTGATTIILNTITFAAGPSMWVFPVAINFATGLSVTIGGTIDFTVLWN